MNTVIPSKVDELESKPGESRQNHRLLVVDDNLAIHADFRKIFLNTGSGNSGLDATEAALFGDGSAPKVEQGFDLEFATQGQEAIEMVRRSLDEGRPYSVAFIDVRMPPGLDGIQTTAKIWEIYPQLQVVFCTAYSDYSWEQMAEMLGTLDSFVILKKPFEIVEVLQMAHAFARKWQLSLESQEYTRRLWESEQRHQLLLNTIPGIVWTARPDGTVDFGNQWMLDYSGQSLEQIAGWNWQEMLHPDDVSKTLTRWNESLRGGSPFEIEYRVRRASDGSFRWHLGRAIPVRDADHEIVQWIGTATDIDEQKRAEAILQESRAGLETRVKERTRELADTQVRFEHLLRSSPAVIYSLKTDSHGNISFISQNVEGLFGYHPGQFLENARFWAQCVHEDDAAILRSHRFKLLSGEPHIAEYRLRHAGGTYLWIRDQARLIRDFRGAAMEVVGSLVDISERKSDEEALRLSEGRFASAFENAAIGMGLLSPEGRWLKVNRALCNLTGYSADELAELTVQDITHPDDVEKSLECARKLLAGEVETYKLEKRYFHKLGRTVWVLLNVSLVRDAQGEVVHFIAQIRDITETKVASDELKVSEERFRLMVNSIGDHAIVMLDPEGCVISWNPGAERIHGFNAEEIVGQNFSRFYPAEALKALVPQELLRIASCEGRHEDEGWRTRKDGSRFLASVVISAVHDAKGVLRGFAKVTRDITSQKLGEERMRLQTSALQAAANGILITDRDGRIIWINPAFTRLTGYSSAEVVGRTPAFLRSGKHGPDFYKSLWTTISAGNVWHGHMINLRKDGSEYTEEMTVTPVRNKHGEIENFIAIKQDISERKQTEELIAYERDLLTTLMENSPDYIYFKDRDSRFLMCSRTLAEKFGASRMEDVVGKTDFDFFGEIHSRPAFEDEQEIIRTGKPMVGKIEQEAMKETGEVTWALTNKMPMRNKAGEIIGTFGISKDITSLKQAEQSQQMLELQLRQSQKLEAIGQLAAGIAHEINTPTQYVGDNTRFLKDSFDSIGKALLAYEQLLGAAKRNAITPELVLRVEETLAANDLGYLFEQIPAAIKETLEGVERVAMIVRAMKEFSHPGGKEKTAADLNKAIETTVTVARNEWKYVADMELDLAPSLPTVPCFLSEFNQVILNLIVNASHAIGDVVKQHHGTKGKITVSTRLAGDHVVIRVADTGTGIPESARPRIFEPFFTTKDVGKGTGQGLALVYSCIVKKHGGAASFETEAGEGTTFILHLPIAPKVGPEARNNVPFPPVKNEAAVPKESPQNQVAPPPT